MGFDGLLRRVERALIDLDAEAIVASYAQNFFLKIPPQENIYQIVLS